MTAISYTLLIGNLPAEPDLLAAVQQVEVEDHTSMADMLRLRVSIGVRENGSGWVILDDDFFSRLTNVRLMLAVGSGPIETIIDSYVIETSVAFSNQPGQSVLNVVAMDPSVLMNLEEKVRPWPDMADSDVATAIFGEYGFLPQVEQTQPVRQEIEHTTMQRGTDIQFLRQLAQRNGYECFVESNALTGLPEGHFHPPRLDLAPQGVLSINMSHATNVDSFNASFDMLRPTTARALGLDIEDQSDQTAEVESQDQEELGSEPTLGGERPRRVLPSQTGLAETGELLAYAQALVNRSTLAIRAEGDLHTEAYGRILRAKRPVLVRGAGQEFSGAYYVERVLHTLRGDSYTQSFTLSRNALGLTGRERFVQDTALPL